MPPGNLDQWRSPLQQETPLMEASALPSFNSPRPQDSPALGQGKNDLHHPAFLPPCEHGDAGDMHAHAFDLLSLSSSTGTPAPARPPLPASQSTTTAHTHVPSSVPATSYLSSTRPANNVNGSATASGSGAGNGANGVNGVNGVNGNGAVAPKARRMSSSTTGVLGRGKLGLTGDGGLGLVGKDGRAASYTNSATITARRPTLGSSPTPQLFDFAKTDRRSSVGARPSAVPASLPVRGHSGVRRGTAPVPAPVVDDIELDMEFDGDGDEEDEGEVEGEAGSGRSGSADIEMDMDMEEDGEVKGEWAKLALGTGSGGVKGRRKGMVFKCETCSKEYRHPSCLVKHRWEHSPHWKEPTALSMSKHQQVQMLEAAAILAHMDPNQSQGRSLPTDKSLWPAVLSPLGDPKRAPSRALRDPSMVRSPSTSTAAPLTPSSLRESTALSTLAERGTGKERKSSPGSDSTTSSMGAGEPYIPRQAALGIRSASTTAASPYARPTRPVGIDASRAASSLSSSIPGPATPHSVGSLPDMAGLNFQSHSLSHSLSSSIPNAGLSPIPGRSMPVYMRTGMVGGGMFGKISVSRAAPSSSVRSGADLEEEEEEDDEDTYGWGAGGGVNGTSVGVGAGNGVNGHAEERRGEKSSSEEVPGREGEEWGMAMEMEL
ncbi:hypothetical protein IAT38_001784 [Cryptococcus sp. DSM 104549]